MADGFKRQAAGMYSKGSGLGDYRLSTFIACLKAALFGGWTTAILSILRFLWGNLKGSYLLMAGMISGMGNLVLSARR